MTYSHRPFFLRVLVIPGGWGLCALRHGIIGSAEALPILCLRYIRWERERERERDTEREREREKDGSDVTIVALKLAMSFALLLAKNVHLSIGEEFCAFPCQKICTLVSPLLNGAEFTLSVAKNVALFETVRVLRTVKWRDWQGIEAAKQTIEFPAALLFFFVEKSKKWIKLIPKTIGNRKRDCAWGCAWGINTTWENLQIEKHKSGRRSFRSPNWFVLFDLQIFSGGVYSRSATSRTISFSISNSFWYYPNFNGSHFGLPPSEIHRMTGLPPKIVWTMTYSHRPHFFGCFQVEHNGL